MSFDIWWNGALHLLEYVGTTTYCSLERIACQDLVLWLWYCYFWRGWIHLLRGKEAIMQWFGRCRSLQIEYSVSIVSLFIENKVLEWHFLGIFTLAASKTVKASHISQFSLQFTASSCHWIVYEGVLALDTTIFDGCHCEYGRLWYCILWVKFLKWKMTISHKVERSRRHANMFWDHNNIVEKDVNIWFERGVI